MKDLISYSPKYSNKQNLIFIIINKNNDYYDIQFKIDNLILKNIYCEIILNCECYHPDNKKYKIDIRIKSLFHNFYNEALKYSNKKDFLKYSKNIYMKAYVNNWLDEICIHMTKSIKYTKEYCKNIALKFNTRIEFQKNNFNIYAFCWRYDWLDEVCEHMKNKEIYTFQTVSEKANLCKTKTEFLKKYPNHYDAAIKKNRLNCLDEICIHMKPLHIKQTIKVIKENALLCKSKTEFSEKYSSSYSKALRLGIIDEICIHMNQFLSSYYFPRIIYAYIFEENKTIYIGLTKNFHKRNRLRIYKNNDSVMNYIKMYKIKPKILFLTKFISAKEAQLKEIEFINKYKSNGWNLLNQVKGGSLGSNPKRIII